ncbi:MAG TPA: aminotransferase class I/II-fold pyridoxal phosphate-dependent enzyme [Opitutaceae bacterium]|nr:aminotransferase class I/II-fold pyridoxal phosphate-dependent enzyme [Opitutaceae bacterium]
MTTPATIAPGLRPVRKDALGAEPAKPRPRPSLFSRRTRLLGSENAFRIGPQIKALEDQGLKVIKCNLGEPDFPLAAHIAEEVKRQIDLGLTHYCDPQGILPLREAIARTVARRRDIEVSPDRVVVFPGGKPPIGLAQQTYCDPGDEVIYPSPGFPIYESFTSYVGARPRPLHLLEESDFSFSGRDLAPLINHRTRIIVLNFPSNPTGSVVSREQLESIAEVIRRKAPANARIYSDEIYEDILYDGNRHHSIASVPGMAQRTVIVSGVSKSYAWTGGRVGWAVFPTAEEATVFKNLNINYFSCLPAYNQMGARVALESPLSRAGIARMCAAFTERRDLMVAGLNAIPGIRCRRPGGAFYLFPNIAGLCENLGAIEAHRRLPVKARGRTSPSTLVQMFLLWRYQVATMDRRSFGRIGSDGLHYLRLSIATGLDDLRTGLERLRAAAADHRGFQAFIQEGEHPW